jgi:adenosylcobinamide kinase/adenosylcobinamide-phosphate guanylyltransferase
MLTNLLWEYPGMNFDQISMEMLQEVEVYVTEEFVKLIKMASKIRGKVVLVTNEIGSGPVPENAITRAFRDIAGRINQRIAADCNEVYLTVCGIPVKIK